MTGGASWTAVFDKGGGGHSPISFDFPYTALLFTARHVGVKGSEGCLNDYLRRIHRLLLKLRASNLVLSKSMYPKVNLGNMSERTAGMRYPK